MNFKVSNSIALYIKQSSFRAENYLQIERKCSDDYKRTVNISKSSWIIIKQHLEEVQSALKGKLAFDIMLYKYNEKSLQMMVSIFKGRAYVCFQFNKNGERIPGLGLNLSSENFEVFLSLINDIDDQML